MSFPSCPSTIALTNININNSTCGSTVINGITCPISYTETDCNQNGCYDHFNKNLFVNNSSVCWINGCGDSNPPDGTIKHVNLVQEKDMNYGRNCVYENGTILVFPPKRT